MPSIPANNENPAASAGPVAVAFSAASSPGRSYGQILKSSAMIGGASVINIAIGLVRTKAMAVILGPAGFGLMGLYTAVADFARSVAEVGINSSGVRQIAEAVGSGESRRIARTASVLRRMSVYLGLLGALLLIVFSYPVSLLTFGDRGHVGPIALLSLAVFFRLVADGQGALIQGMRRISDLAKMGIIGAALGTLLSIPIVYFLRENGVVLSLICVAAVSWMLSWWYSRKVKVEVPEMTSAEVRMEAGALLKLGFAFMASAMMTMGAAYAIRMIVLRTQGLEAAGYYQAAWVLGGLYVGFVLQAMGADFYPRLTGVAWDREECNRLVNEQAHVSLLLAGPGVVGTLALSPVVITLLYSAEFKQAVEILRWFCLGMTLRVIAWPMGYVLLARSERKLFFWTEVAATVVHVGLAWLCLVRFGLRGAGIAFFGLYVWHGILIYLIVRRLTGFRWSRSNRKTALLSFLLIGGVFCSSYILPFRLALAVGVVGTLVSSVYSLRILADLVSWARIPKPLQLLLVKSRVARPKE